MILVKGKKYDEKRSRCLCVVSRCDRKTSGKKYRFCTKHKHQYHKEINPVSYWYSIHKQNAKRRKIEWLLTLEEFRDFCEQHNFLQLKGKFKDNLTIDRIFSWEGYHKDNIRVLKCGVNARKSHMDMKLREKYGHSILTGEEREALKQQICADSPFDDEDNPF